MNVCPLFSKGNDGTIVLCKKGEPTVYFCLIGALLPTESSLKKKSKTTFFYSNLNLKKEKKKVGKMMEIGEIEGRHKSLLALSARSYQKLFRRDGSNFFLVVNDLLFSLFA
ncbi:hypothetical protein QL285_096002 [Trifolium repens]|nr:hypothetical protein QL285_096002 [Trifolium repens]